MVQVGTQGLPRHPMATDGVFAGSSVEARGMAALPGAFGPGVHGGDGRGGSPSRPDGKLSRDGTPASAPYLRGRKARVADGPEGVVVDAAAAEAQPVAEPEGPDDAGAVIANSEIRVGESTWARLLIRTHVIQPGEDIAAVVQRYARPHIRAGDWVFVGQKAVSISQHRLVYERAVRPRPLAVLLSRHVKKTPYGRGLGRPATMELAIREAGALRILAAAAIHVLGRPLGRSGDFYRVAGRRVASIDGVTEWALPPFNRYIVLHPTDADGAACRIAERVGAPTAIVDLNDLGGVILGASPEIDRDLFLQVLADNPLGQGPFRTPLGLARLVSSDGTRRPPADGQPDPSAVC